MSVIKGEGSLKDVTTIFIPEYADMNMDQIKNNKK